MYLDMEKKPHKLWEGKCYLYISIDTSMYIPLTWGDEPHDNKKILWFPCIPECQLQCTCSKTFMGESMDLRCQNIIIKFKKAESAQVSFDNWNSQEPSNSMKIEEKMWKLAKFWRLNQLRLRAKLNSPSLPTEIVCLRSWSFKNTF